MKRSEIIDRLVREHKISRSCASEIVNLLFDEIINLTVLGGRLDIRKFGSFKLKRMNGRFIKNPKSGVEMFIEERYTINFKPSEKLLERLHGKG